MGKNKCSSNARKMHKYSTGTDGIRTIGRTRHVSLLKSYSLVKAICLSTRKTLSLPHHEMIRLHLPLTIRCFCLCLATLKLYLIRAGRSRPRHGAPCSSVSTRENRCVTSRLITACRMKRSGGCSRFLWHTSSVLQKGGVHTGRRSRQFWRRSSACSMVSFFPTGMYTHWR